MIDIVSEVGTAPARPRPLPYDVIVDILVAVPSHIVFT